MFKKTLFMTVTFVFLCTGVFADTTMKIEPYTKDEFPDWARDLRRAEIVSLGSLPFTSLSVTLSYSIYRYIDSGFNKDYFPNPLAKSSEAANLTVDEQKRILNVSICLSLAVGIADFIVSAVKHSNEAKRNTIRLEEQNRFVHIEGMNEIPEDEYIEVPVDEDYIEIEDVQEAAD